LSPRGGRCLEDYELSVGQELDLFYLPHAQGRPQEQEEEVELTDREVVVGYYDGERRDLGEVLREQIVLGLPLRRLCREDCLGRCPSCGQNRNQVSCACPPAEGAGDREATGPGRRPGALPERRPEPHPGLVRLCTCRRDRRSAPRAAAQAVSEELGAATPHPTPRHSTTRTA